MQSIHPNPGLKSTSRLLALAFIAIGSRDFWAPAIAAGATDDAPTSLTATMILNRVATVYATAKSYQDTGVVKPSTEGLSDSPFNTAYRAPDRFRFEFIGMHPAMISFPGGRGIVYRNGDDVQQWFLSKASTPPSLNMALARATGVSSMAAHNIPALLMPRTVVSGRRLTDDTGASLLPEAPCDGSICFRIQETSLQAEITQTLWIDRTSFLIRRIDSHLTPPGNVALDLSTFYQPVINEPVPDSALEFDAPSTGTASANASTSSRPNLTTPTN
jgi:outer membrane lipoprotein-sorting protein